MEGVAKTFHNLCHYLGESSAVATWAPTKVEKWGRGDEVLTIITKHFKKLYCFAEK